MKVVVFGLGYVGCVSATCLADIGHTVVGVDSNPTKVDQVNGGVAPMVEPHLAERLEHVVSCGRLRAVIRPEDAPADADVFLICVGTASSRTGAVDYRDLAAVADDVAACLARTTTFPVVAIRSTVLPGIVRQKVLDRLERTGLRAGTDFGLCVNPEFLREGSAIADFLTPPFTLIGELDRRSGDVLEALYEDIDAPVVRTNLDVASMVKYASNAYHAIKVVFANEVGVLCGALNIDSHAVMDIVCRDTKLNVSSSYLKPGFAFGGSCLPKDLRALLHEARHQDLDLPLLNAVFPSNDRHLQRAVDAISGLNRRRIGVVGLSFKPHTDDLRESPLVILVERLIGKGFDVAVFDAEVSMSRVFGRNRAYIDRTIPHITRLMCNTLDELIDRSDVVVIGKRFDGVEAGIHSRLRPEQRLVDLARVWRHDTAAFAHQMASIS